MLSGSIISFLMTAFAALMAGFGLYARGQHYKIKSLNKDKEIAERKASSYKKIAHINKAKAGLQKDVAREIVKNNSLENEKVKKIQDKIDAIKDGEEFTVTI